jgi:transcriptional regulator with XRE-family HTH domain
VWSNAGRAIRALRQRRGWTQDVLGAQASVSRELVSRAERGRIRSIPLGSIERMAEALGASVSLTVRWNGEQLDRLIDARHAAIQEATASLLALLGWEVRPEVSFNHFGDRGRIDLLAYNRPLRLLLVVEVKSGIGDLQDTLGRLDVKMRVARHVARDLGWQDALTSVPAMVIGESRRSRHVVAEHAALFAGFTIRGRAALAWVRQPVLPAPTGLLWFAERADAARVGVGARARRSNRSNRSNSHQA